MTTNESDHLLASKQNNSKNQAQSINSQNTLSPEHRYFREIFLAASPQRIPDQWIKVLAFIVVSFIVLTVLLILVKGGVF